MRYIILFLLPLLLSANLTYLTNQTKEIAILESFDIEASFLYDPIMNEMKNSKRDIYDEENFFQAMDEAHLFIPTVKNILAEHGVPPEFLFLAMAESSFSTRAYSVKKASGFWQFMPETGKLYGLIIDQYVDERRDVIKSTEAAAKYLTALYEKFGKWYLAALAFNCGEGRVANAIRRAKSDDLLVLLDSKEKYIPRESRLYIRKILSLALMGNDEQFLHDSEYDYLLNRANAFAIATVEVPRGESLTRVSKLIEIPLPELQKLNKHLKYDFAPPNANEYAIYIPYVKLSDFKQKYVPQKMQNFYKVHVVAKGESLYTIGKKYNVSQNVIKDFNALKDNKLSFNQKLIIPIAQRVASAREIGKEFAFYTKYKSA
ncbi:MAG: transglycosylase SLT domain-containing protein [Sulfurimonas sp.]|uniref:lytic transglycosylase domain-containing protein n=1 Tax=Sulfurimonas sp. TaxID=2022749 RepID=UPI002620D54D|nr:lytic transglycosylase domain-containing protein [Sulfurimonas sp.]MDD2652616.1 transglycosylase SLT domain-containing protein [Sulfurimonas sp.]MDD3450758.1 transglycosylase SLT domain-containing protein [Sulfurimonas sp.]